MKRSMTEVQVSVADWQTTPALRSIRQAVFVQEQHVSPELEWDAADADATHFLLTIRGRAVGTARLLSCGRIGRVAVLADARGQGLGKMLMKAVMQHAQAQGLQRLELSAQTHALEFYRELGFVVCSDVYLDAGIAHQTMRYPGPSQQAASC